MNNLYELLKIHFLGYFGLNSAFHSKDKRERSKLIMLIIVMIYCFVVIGLYSGGYSYAIGTKLNEIGSVNSVIAIMMIISAVVSLFTTILKVNGFLFKFKDYDLLMSLPIDLKTIISSRILSMYLVNMVAILIIMVPAGIVYSMLSGAGLLFYILYLILIPFIPVVPIILGTVLGFLIALISSKFRHSNFIGIALFLIAIVGIIFTANYSTKDASDIANVSVFIETSVSTYYPLTKLFMNAVCNYNFLSFILFIIISIAIAILFVKVISYKFKSINTRLISAKTKGNYKIKDLKQDTVIFALYKKEISRYFSSTLYVINTSIGAILSVIGSIVILVIGGDNINIPKELINYLPIVVSALMLLTSTTACSISLEGNKLWLSKSLPVDTFKIFLSKIAVNLTLCIPAIIIDAFILLFAFKLNIINFVLLLIMPAAFAVFISFAGIVVNLRFPNLDWTTEVTPIKQSASVIVTMLIGMLLVILLIGATVILRNLGAQLVLILVTVLVGVIDLLLYRYLKNKGVKRFIEL